MDESCLFSVRFCLKIILNKNFICLTIFEEKIILKIQQTEFKRMFQRVK